MFGNDVATKFFARHGFAKLRTTNRRQQREATAVCNAALRLTPGVIRRDSGKRVHQAAQSNAIGADIARRRLQIARAL